MALSYEFIASYTAPSNQQYITFNNIPQTYTHLVLKGNERSNRSGGDDGGVQYFYNNSRAANYSRASAYLYYAASVDGYSETDVTYIGVEGIPQTAGTAADFYGFFEICIPNYSTSSRYHPSVHFAMNTRQANPGGIYAEGGGLRYVVDNITRIDLMTDTAGTNFITGSSWYLYGIKSA